MIIEVPCTFIKRDDFNGRPRLQFRDNTREFYSAFTVLFDPEDVPEPVPNTTAVYRFKSDIYKYRLGLREFLGVVDAG